MVKPHNYGSNLNWNKSLLESCVVMRVILMKSGINYIHDIAEMVKPQHFWRNFGLFIFIFGCNASMKKIDIWCM